MKSRQHSFIYVKRYPTFSTHQFMLDDPNRMVKQLKLEYDVMDAVVVANFDLSPQGPKYALLEQRPL